MKNQNDKSETKRPAEEKLVQWSYTLEGKWEVTIRRRLTTSPEDREFYELIYGKPGEYPACDWNLSDV